MTPSIGVGARRRRVSWLSRLSYLSNCWVRSRDKPSGLDSESSAISTEVPLGGRAGLAGRLRAGLKGLDLSTFFQLPLNTWIFRNLPAWVSRLYLGGLGRLYFQLAKKERSAIVGSLAFCLGETLGSPAARRRWSQVRGGIVNHYHEKLFLALKSVTRIRRHCQRNVAVANQEVLDKALAQGRGVLLVTGHYGAVEFMPGALAFRGYPLSVMVHCKTPQLKSLLEERASHTGTELLDPKSGQVFFEALNHLKRGRIVITQCDEMDMWRPYRDKTVDFLGLDLKLDRSMDILARKSKAVVVLGLVHRQGHGKYELELIDPQQHPAAHGASLISVQCLSVLSAHIYARPQEWYEWKKLRPFVDASLESIAHEDTKTESLFNKMAVHLGGIPQPSQ